MKLNLFFKIFTITLTSKKEEKVETQKQECSYLGPGCIEYAEQNFIPNRMKEYYNKQENYWE